jgi:DNA-binding NtrC family response regulator
MPWHKNEAKSPHANWNWGQNMSYIALFTSVPPLQQTYLSDLERLIRSFGIDIRPVPFQDSLSCRTENVLAVVIAVARDSALHVFFWDPAFLSLLGDSRDDAGLYESLMRGCIDFLSWPCHHAEFAARIRRLKERGDAPGTGGNPSFGARAHRALGMVGCSDGFMSALQLTAKFARYEVPVLLEGETGTGKELFARALHYLGPRHGQPFVPVNCGALPDTLIENELFGHVSGAYTGARGSVDGMIAQADGGTLFFDEVHCLSPKGQATLLRFAQDQQYRPLGASAPLRRANVRLVAATNQCLWNRVLEGDFREDLFYRLNVGYVRLPPLRERKEDIPVIVDSIATRLCARYGTGPRRFDASSLAWMSAQPWRGNVRELENFVQREFMLSDDAVIRIDPRRCRIAAEAFSPETDSHPCFNEARARALKEFEGDYIRRMLVLTGGNVSEAARQAGKDRRVFGRLMKKYGIDRGEFGRGHD